jgi:ADP-heptose:LPS heptosyltransferase
VTPHRPALVILRALGLGDFLTGVPAYRALRAGYPGHEVILAAPRVLQPLAMLTGAIDRVLPVGELEPIPWPGAPPSVAVDLHGHGPASHRLVRSLNAAITMMYASAADPLVTGPWWDAREHEVDRWCRLVEWWGMRADRSALRLGRPPPQDCLQQAIILHPGAASGSRRWPAERYAAVARSLSAEGLSVLITGTAPERPLAHQVAAAAGLRPEAVAAGRTSLTELAALVASAALVISNDTGMGHLAVAFGIPSVTLFGPVSPKLWGPPPGAGRHIALWRGTGDRPGNPHDEVIDGRLLRIGVDDVLAAVEALRPVLATARQPT